MTDRYLILTVSGLSESESRANVVGTVATEGEAKQRATIAAGTDDIMWEVHSDGWYAVTPDLGELRIIDLSATLG